MQLSLAVAARDEAIDRVERHAEPDWKVEAAQAVRATAATRELFTTDDIVCSAPREPRAWGAIMRAAQRAGVIEGTGMTRRSTSRTCHARPKAVWRSLM